MHHSPQERRCFFVTAVGANRRNLFQTEWNCELFLSLIRGYREMNRFALHCFVLMPDHLHSILTPAPEISLEKAMQFIKGRFSFELKKQFGDEREVWQKGYNEDRLRSLEDFHARSNYIHENPVRAGLAKGANSFAWSSARMFADVGPMPEWFRRG
ncbi:MAG: transposase [Acidobacteriaceae bacterium]